MYGAGHKFRTLHLPVSTTLAEVLDRVSGKFTTVCFLFKIVYMSLCLFFFLKAKDILHVYLQCS